MVFVVVVVGVATGRCGGRLLGAFVSSCGCELLRDELPCCEVRWLLDGVCL